MSNLWKKLRAAKNYHGTFAKNMLGLELADQLSRVIPSVLSNDRGQLSGKQIITIPPHINGRIIRDMKKKS